MSNTVTEPEVANNAAVMCGEIRRIPLARIAVGERKRVPDHAGLDQLKADIRLNGLLQPIGIKRINEGGDDESFRVVYGLRRFAASPPTAYSMPKVRSRTPAYWPPFIRPPCRTGGASSPRSPKTCAAGS
jgi:hypothetical protein